MIVMARMALRTPPPLQVQQHAYVRSAVDPWVCIGLPGKLCHLPARNRVHVDAEAGRVCDPQELAAGENVRAA